VSIESASRPGFFYRHRNGFLELDRNDGTDTMFGQDSSFMLRPGLLDGEAAVGRGAEQLVSLRSINYPHSYVKTLFSSKIWSFACALRILRV
jgi:hypothetical protein